MGEMYRTPGVVEPSAGILDRRPFLGLSFGIVRTTPYSCGLRWVCLTALALQVVAQPVLDVSLRPDGNVVLQWPNDPAGVALERTTTLPSAGPWAPVTNAPSSQGAIRSVVLAPDAATAFFRLRATESQLTTLTEFSPSEGESGVATTRETVFRFSSPIRGDQLINGSQIYAEQGERRILSRAEIGQDRLSLTLFYLENLPPSARLRVTLDATDVLDGNGLAVDADGDGQPGGMATLSFDTGATSGLPGTGVVGRVYASERNPDGSNRPLANVTVSVDGAEESLRAVTDAAGFFRLSPSPVGRFFVHVDGRTAVGSQWPTGAYYPFVGKAWTAIAGTTNTPAGGTGEIFLPLIPADALTPTKANEATSIRFSAATVATNPALAEVEVSVPANALFSDNGTRGGSVGIAAVAPGRLPEPLPPGLNLPLVITIQTDGGQNFSQPVPVKFPNLPDPVTGLKLPPGSKTLLWSFNHDTGRWEPQGTATISADGLFAITDPGVGVRQPGWHGVSAGSGGTGPGRPPGGNSQRGGGSSGGGGDGGGCQEGEDCDCTQEITCTIPRPGKFSALCALDCLGDVVDDLFGDGEKPERTAFETGLRCIGGPDTCPGNPESTLNGPRRKCMNECTHPLPDRVTYTVPCEGFIDPCPRPNLQGHARLSASGAFADLLPDRLEEQFRFWDVEGEFLKSLTGSPKILDNSPEDARKLTALFAALSPRVRPGSPAGVNLSASERTELIALPRPLQISAGEWAAIVDRLDSIQGKPLPPELALAEKNLTDLTAELKARGWKYRDDGLLTGLTRLSRSMAVSVGSDTFPARSHHFYLKNHRNGSVQRGRLNASGLFEDIILAPGGFYTVAYLDPVTRRAGAAFFSVGQARLLTTIPTAPLEAESLAAADDDGDGLSNGAELILATQPNQSDTDGDGIPDGAEFAAGTNPLDGQPATVGVIAVNRTAGSALDVSVWNELAAIADGPGGVALFDVNDPTAPVLLAQYKVAGDVGSVAGAGSLLAAATRNGEVALIDVINPTSPKLIARVPLGSPVTAVTIVSGRVVAGLDSGELVFLSGIGQEIVRTAADPVAVEDVLSTGGLVYSLKVGSLTTYAINGRQLTLMNQVEVPGTLGAGRRRLRLSGGIDRLFSSHSTGFNVFDITEPAKPVHLLQTVTRQFGWKQMVPDGSRLGLGAVGANSTDDGSHDISIYTVETNGMGTNLLITLSTPGLAAAVGVHKGMALVADGASGLTVLNYRPREGGTIPPSITLHPRFSQAIPPAQENGATFTVTARTTDDVFVREVEFYLDGQLLAADGNFPFEADLRAPVIKPGTTQLTLQARAIDAAGNATWSSPINAQLVPDATPPNLLALSPAAESLFLFGTPITVSARFDEPIASESIREGFTLIQPGADGNLGTGDDVPVTTTLTPLSNHEFVLNFAQPLPVGSYASHLSSTISDLVGNHLAEPIESRIHIRPLVEYVGPAGSVWGSLAQEANNWSSARIPATNDFVRIARPGNELLKVPEGVSVVELTAISPMEFGGGFNPGLTVRTRAVFDAPLTIQGGGWIGQKMTFGNQTDLFHAVNASVEEWINEGRFVMHESSSLSQSRGGSGLTSVHNAPTGIWEMNDARVAVLGQRSAPVEFLNEGRLIALGNFSQMAPSRFVNLGVVEVHAGLLQIAAGESIVGPSRHLGTYRIDAGGTLEFSGTSARLGNGVHEFGRLARIYGDGDVKLINASIPSSYEVHGSNTIVGNVTFNGPVNSRGTWSILRQGGQATFSGLSPQLTGRVKVEGTLVVAVQPTMHLRDLRVIGNLTVHTALQMNGPLRLESQAPNTARLLGAGRVRANGPLTFSGIVNSTGTGFLEIAAAAGGTTGSIVQFDNSGYALRVLPTGNFNLNGITRVTVRGGVTNEGTMTKSDAAETELTRTFQNAGTLHISDGTVVVQNGAYIQTAGVTTLAGGRLTVRRGSGIAVEISCRILGGALEGAGILTCGSLFNQALVSPGTTAAPYRILDLQVGTHSTLSVYDQGGGATLSMDLGGTAPGTSHDQLKVSGRALLGGTLNLKIAPNFVPAIGQEFIILTANRVERTFGQVVVDRPLIGMKFNVIYEATRVKVAVVAP